MRIRLVEICNLHCLFVHFIFDKFNLFILISINEVLLITVETQMKCEIASWYVLLSKIKTIFCAPKNIYKFLHTHFFRGRGVGGDLVVSTNRLYSIMLLCWMEELGKTKKQSESVYLLNLILSKEIIIHKHENILWQKN